MILKEHARLALRGTDRSVKEAIAESAGVNLQTVYKWIKSNDDNLTKAACLSIICEAIGMGSDQILESSKPQETH